MRSAVIATGLCLSLTGPCFAQTSTAAMGRVETHIPPQALEGALKQLAKLDHIRILYLDAAVDNVRTAGASGYLTAGETLTCLLTGTGLKYRYIDSNTVSIILVHADARAVQDPPLAATPPHRLGKNRFNGSKTNAPGYTTTEPKGQSKRQKENATLGHNGAALREVLVTGTRIAGVVPVGVSIDTITSLQIQRSGYTTLDQLLQSLPDNFRGGAAGATADALFSRGSKSSDNITFGSGVNLRGLGNNATLVLVDGHRIPSSGNGYYTDISGIPLSAIDRIDVLTDGASAIYGTDAVAGVVNIILKKQSEGVDSELRYGVADGFAEYDATSAVGHESANGGFTLDADYFGQGALDVRDRSFTSSVRSPTSLLPMVHRASLLGAGHDRIGKSVTVLADFAYSDRRGLENEGVYGALGYQTIIDVPSWSGSLTAQWQSPSSWAMSADVSGGEGTETTTTNSFAMIGSPTLLDGLKDVSRYFEPRVEATGSVASLPGGAAKLAAGASYMVSDYSLLNTNSSGAVAVGGRSGARRDVSSVYGELLVPVVGYNNAIVGMDKLTLSAAGRYDRYSDFGGTTNYKVGFSWYPVTAFQVRGAYSTSFRAPAVGIELVDSQRGTTALLLRGIENPSRSALVPVLFEEGAVPRLQPETATNLTLGLDYLPPAIPNLRLSADYYRILYTNQIAAAPIEQLGLSDPSVASAITQYSTSAPIEALASATVANGVPLFNATAGQFGQDPLSKTLFLYDIRLANLARTDTSGFDFNEYYRLDLADNTIDTAVRATYIQEFLTQLTPSAPVVNLVNTVGYPARFRMSAQAAWTRDRLTVALTGNYVGPYRDTSSLVGRDVGSYLTANVMAEYRFSRTFMLLRGASMAIAVTNVFNRNPPYVVSGSLAPIDAHYDGANASPIGRLISLDIAKHW